MNASVRWAKHFVDALECVKCRRKDDLTLYYFHGKPVEPEKMTIERLRWSLDRMDTWCSTCPVIVNTRVAGPGRRARKDEAAHIANVRSQLTYASRYDEYVLDGGPHITKYELLDRAKQLPCFVCNQTYPEPVMDFYHVDLPKRSNISSMPGHVYTLQEMISEIEKCALVCANCHRLITHGLVGVPKEKIHLDRNFFRSIRETNNIR